MHSSRDSVLVGLPWHSLREPNLGVGAFTLAHLSMLKTAADAAQKSLSVRIFDPIGGPHWYPHNEVPVQESLYNWNTTDVFPESAMWRDVGRCDVILDIGAGEISSDVYGSDFSFAVVLSRMAALAQKKPMILSPQTIGPFKSPYLRELTAQIVRRCRRTYTRDGESFLFLKEMGLVEGIEESTDLAFRLPFNPRPRTPDPRIQFGLSISALLYHSASTKFYSFDLAVDYPSLVERIINDLIRRSDISLVLVPHCVGNEKTYPYSNDVWVCRKLADKYGVPVAPEFKSPVEAKSFISGLDVLAGSRMHATIAALSSGVPVIPLGHTRKFNGIFNSLRYPVMCDLRSQDGDGALACINDAIERLPELRAAAVNSSAMAQSKLDGYQTFLNELLISLP